MSVKIEEELKNFILLKHKSIRAFSTYSEIPYSTIDNIFKRSLSGASLNNVKRICSTLNIDINSLANNEIKELGFDISIEPKTPNVSGDEQKLLENYNLLNEEGQAYVDKQIKFALSQTEYQKIDLHSLSS